MSPAIHMGCLNQTDWGQCIESVPKLPNGSCREAMGPVKHPMLFTVIYEELPRGTTLIADARLEI